MLRSLLLGTAALLLSSSANACKCLLPPPLSDCEVRDDQAALLVTIKCVKTLACDINTGVAVADVVIDKVFKDKTDLDLSQGDMVTVSSLLQSATCGIGASFVPGQQWIMFANTPFEPPIAPFDDLVLPGGRRLQQSDKAKSQTRRAAVSVNAVNANGTEAVDVVADADAAGVFSDGSICDVDDSDLETNICAGNIIEPTQSQINQLMQGCSILIPPIITSKRGA